MQRARTRRARSGGRALLSHRERTELAVGRMIEAGLRVMGRDGYEAATLAAIGEAAGYSRGLATHHFGTKAGLFAAVLRALTDEFTAILDRRVGERSGVDALIGFVVAHRELAESTPDRVRAAFVLSFQSLIAHSPMKDAAIHELLTYRARAQQMIERGIAAGTVRGDVDAHGEAIQFCGTLFGLTLQWLIDPAGTPLDRAHARLVDRLERTLRAAGSSRGEGGRAPAEARHELARARRRVAGRSSSPGKG